MDEKLWGECIKFHGHACPGLAFGYKASATAAEILGIPLEKAGDEEIVCISENDACGVDCIQYLLSCTIGKGNLLLRITGKPAYTFFRRDSGKGIRLIVKNFDKESYSREELIQHILDSPAEDIFEMSEPRSEMPEKARMFQSVVCECCGEAAREDKIRLQDGKKVCLDCFESYERFFL
ncbi:formylmethanofuran dehydrogenase [Candidatus Methanomassiliicoccus intestinalis]|jgi:hypothetical protein cdifQCD-2_00876|uniref:Formylmethanofuran dehydrogenase, subunit E n=1 Tax=Methanomassiliicoccus intestinalis (strain Issoire-Mx1) TaxID=1295009 RepID=R9T784_METII|nr:FmdE family protein [Candidatus Methanomassiliicoccus intestinalis]AGN26565.1 formylmethanofuran dehydrogenase, subunit E [Candidatus Methanomassiliicoccus intestinalis Issoire-Mx1]TQS84178.1 MAG: formylmethanofuran dehydrogenase [Candidatus Methanomassiliicoccus intestinalis]